MTRNLAMVFQNLALFPHLTARKNIAFPLVRRNVPPMKSTRRLDRLSGVLGIAHILHKKPARSQAANASASRSAAR